MKLGLRTGDIKGAAGSSYVELNGTKVFAAVYGPIEPENQDSAMTGVVECILEDTWDDTAQMEGLQHKLQHTFAATICRDSYLKTLIRIAISVVNPGLSLSDAATLAGSLALADAGIQMTDFVVSCTAGLIADQFTAFADSETKVRVAILPSKDEIIETEVIGKVDCESMVAAVEVACSGCRELTQSLRRFISATV